MGNYQPIYKRLWTLSGSGLGTTLNANGDSTGGNAAQVINLQETTDLVLSVKTGTPGGTAPTLLVQVDMLDAEGNWITQVMKTASITAAGLAVVYAGLHVGGANAVVFTGSGRIAWTIGGTAGPNWPGTTIALMGR